MNLLKLRKILRSAPILGPILGKIADIQRLLIYRHQIRKIPKILTWQQFPMFAPNSSGTPAQRNHHTVNSINSLIPVFSEILKDELIGTQELEVYFRNLMLEGKSLFSEELRELFFFFGSDKSMPHNYELFYSTLFQQKDEVESIIEIGIGSNNLSIASNMGIHGRPGSSLRAFRSFFPNAQVFGADIDRDILFTEDRIKTFWVDQTSSESIKLLFENFNHTFDIIIDDGLHSIEANAKTLLESLPYLSPGGWFIIEDIPSAAVDFWRLVGGIYSNRKYFSVLLAAKDGYIFALRNQS